MAGTTVHSGAHVRRPVGTLETVARRGVLRRLEDLQDGELSLVDSVERRTFGKCRASNPIRATLTVNDPAFYLDVALGGALGAAESYMGGRWDTDDLTALLRIFARNLDAADAVDTGLARLRSPIRRLLHRLRKNHPLGSRRNIAAHYDLGNDFFELFLDDTWMYSCAMFERESDTLKEASVRKLDAVCRKLQLQPEDEVLEIGTGWGGFAIHAAKHYGCRVVTTTISRRQHELACARVLEAGLQDQITVLLEDYRDLPGLLDRRFGKLVSIEMIEAVGHDYLDEYISTCSRLLAPEGLFLLQAITIADQRYEAYRRSVDFIQRYIFPGGHLPSLEVLTRCVSRSSDLRITHLEDLTCSYARTLREWRSRFLDSIPSIHDLGFDDHFVRMWKYYFCYCEAGFLERTIGDLQILLSKPRSRRAAIRSRLGDMS